MDMEIVFPGGKRVDALYKGFRIETDQSPLGGGDGSGGGEPLRGAQRLTCGRDPPRSFDGRPFNKLGQKRYILGRTLP